MGNLDETFLTSQFPNAVEHVFEIFTKNNLFSLFFLPTEEQNPNIFFLSILSTASQKAKVTTFHKHQQNDGKWKM